MNCHEDDKRRRDTQQQLANELFCHSSDQDPTSMCYSEWLAPMVRASTVPLRMLAYGYGASGCYSEELVDRAILGTTRVVNTTLHTVDYIKEHHQNTTSSSTPPAEEDATTAATKKRKRKNQKPQKKNRPPVIVLRIATNELPLSNSSGKNNKFICQIGTGTVEYAVQAAQHVRNDVCGIDINMGCPKKFSTTGGMGSRLLSDQDRACAIVSAVSCAMRSNNSEMAPIRPVSAKIRLLPGPVEATVDFVAALIEAGANAIAIHGRHVTDTEQNSAHRSKQIQVVQHVKTKYPNTPILLNGDYYTRTEIAAAIRACKADGVLLARPALYNTSIFRTRNAIEIAPANEASTTGVNSSIQHEYSTEEKKQDGMNTVNDADEDDQKMQSTSDIKLPSAADYKNDYNSDEKTSGLLSKYIVQREYLRYAAQYQAHPANVKYVLCEMLSARRHPTNRVPHLQPYYKNPPFLKHGRKPTSSSTTSTYQQHIPVPTIQDVCKCRTIVEMCQLWDMNTEEATVVAKEAVKTTERMDETGTVTSELIDNTVETAGGRTYTNEYLQKQFS